MTGDISITDRTQGAAFWFLIEHFFCRGVENDVFTVPGLDKHAPAAAAGGGGGGGSPLDVYKKHCFEKGGALRSTLDFNDYFFQPAPVGADGNDDEDESEEGQQGATVQGADCE